MVRCGSNIRRRRTMSKKTEYILTCAVDVENLGAWPVLFLRRGRAMKALTVCQPFAHLIATGRKPIENRHWHTGYRGPLAIHAGKSRVWLQVCDNGRYPGMAFGAVVAIANLVGCVRIGELAEHYPDLAGHPHAEGPWCWILADVERLNPPCPARGRQGLWEWTRPCECRGDGASA